MFLFIKHTPAGVVWGRIYIYVAVHIYISTVTVNKMMFRLK